MLLGGGSIIPWGCLALEKIVRWGWEKVLGGCKGNTGMSVASEVFTGIPILVKAFSIDNMHINNIARQQLWSSQI